MPGATASSISNEFIDIAVKTAYHPDSRHGCSLDERKCRPDIPYAGTLEAQMSVAHCKRKAQMFNRYAQDDPIRTMPMQD
jgi:hypothetical protein